jgi:hypothetical protein
MKCALVLLTKEFILLVEFASKPLGYMLPHLCVLHPLCMFTHSSVCMSIHDI